VPVGNLKSENSVAADLVSALVPGYLYRCNMEAITKRKLSQVYDNVGWPGNRIDNVVYLSESNSLSQQT
jgi:hypothetical protein